MRIKRILINVLLIFLSFIFQCVFGNSIRIGGIMPNICLITVVILSFFNGASSGCILGFIMGLLSDIFVGNYLGMYALLFSSIGFFTGLFTKPFYNYDFDLKFPLILIIIMDFIYNAFIFFIFIILNGGTSFKPYFCQIIIPEIVYTFLVSIIVYLFLYFLEQKIATSERKADGYFVS